MTKPTELAWAAGFYDGEGSCFVDSSGYMSIGIGQCDTEVLERFRNAVGTGGIYGPYNKSTKARPNCQLQWYYRASARHATAVIEKLWPYLGTVKKTQYQEVLAVARQPHKEGFCRKSLHRMTKKNRDLDGRCKACRQARTNKVRVAP